MKKIVTLITSLTLAYLLTACSPTDKKNTLRVGTIVGPDTELVETAARIAKKRFDLDITIVAFNDYIQPNAALAEGSIDANLFQHKPYLDTQVKAKGYPLVAVAKTFIYPVGIYSKKIQHLSELKAGDLVGIPNDPTNEGRALLLLQSAKLIQLKKGAGLLATPHDITENPKKLIFKELSAAQLPRALHDVTIAIINTDYALPAGLMPDKDALLLESADSPYVNILVVHKKNVNNPKVKHFIEALHSDEVIQKSKHVFPHGAAIIGF